MLDGLDAIPWSQLSHAYGAAGDVPDQLRALTADPASREQAMFALSGNIWHQGTVYEATAHAVPFLIEVASTRSLDGRAEVLALVARIQFGQSYNAQHEDLTDLATKATPAWQDERRAQLVHVEAARLAVIAHLDGIVALARSDDARDVRIWALEVLRRAGPAAGAHATVVHDLVTSGGEPAIQGQALASWFAIADPEVTVAAQPDHGSPLLDLVTTTHRVLRRRTLDQDDRRALLAALDAAAELADAYGQMAYRAEDIATDVAELARIGVTDPTLRDALIAWLPRGDGPAAAAIVVALIAMLDHVAPADLDGARRILHAWHEHAQVWTHVAVFEPACIQAKIPWSRDGVAQLLAAPAASVAELRAAAKAIAFPPTILDRELTESVTIATRWVELMQLGRDEQRTLGLELVTLLGGEQACEVAWHGPLMDARGNATEAARTLIDVAVRHDPGGAEISLRRHAARLAEAGPPVRVARGFRSTLNGTFGVVLEGAVTLAELTGRTPPPLFDACAIRVGQMARQTKMWRPSYARYVAVLPHDRAATMPEVPT